MFNLLNLLIVLALVLLIACTFDTQDSRLRRELSETVQSVNKLMAEVNVQ